MLRVQIYDFKNLTAYTNYSTCVAAQPARSISQAWELWKNRVIFSYSGNITVANTGGPCARVLGSAVARANPPYAAVCTLSCCRRDLCKAPCHTAMYVAVTNNPAQHDLFGVGIPPPGGA